MEHKRNCEVLINALLNQKDKRKKSVKFPAHRFIVEVRTDTDEFIDFSTIPIIANEVRVVKNVFNVNLLCFVDGKTRYNITWVSDKDTELILSYIK